MSKITLDLTAAQISQAIDQLPNQDKIKIAKKMDRLSSRIRVRALLNKIDSRKAPRPSPQEILKEIHTYRKEKNARRN